MSQNRQGYGERKAHAGIRAELPRASPALHDVRKSSHLDRKEDHA